MVLITWHCRKGNAKKTINSVVARHEEEEGMSKQGTGDFQAGDLFCVTLQSICQSPQDVQHRKGLLLQILDFS